MFSSAACALILAGVGGGSPGVYVEIRSAVDLDELTADRVLVSAQRGVGQAGMKLVERAIATTTVGLDLVGLGNHVHVQVSLHGAGSNEKVLSVGVDQADIESRLPPAFASIFDPPAVADVSATPQLLVAPPEKSKLAWGPILMGSTALIAGGVTLGLALEARSLDRELRGDGCLETACDGRRVDRLQRTVVAADVALASTIALAAAAGIWAWLDSR